MGKMVMNNTIENKSCVLSGLNSKQKKQNIIVTLAVIVFFVFSAITFMNFLYCLADCIGSIVCASMDISLRDAIRSGPIFLSFFLSLSGLMVAHTFYRNESSEILYKKAKKHSIIGIVLSVIIIVYVIVMRLLGKYLSLVEGAPSLIYPLDAIIYAIIFIALDIIVLMYLKKVKDTQCFVGPCRAPIQKRGRGVRSFFRTFWLLVALYGFCGFFYSIFIVDFEHGYVFYSIAVMVASLVALLSIAFWELYYNNLTIEKRKKSTLVYALVSLGVSVVSMVIYLMALKNNLDGPSNVGFGVLPVAFAANVNIAMLIVVIMPLIVSITALIKGIIRKVKLKKESK